MTDRVIVNADRTAILPPNSPHKGYRISIAEAVELGLVSDKDAKPQERRTGGTPEKVGPIAKAPQRRRTAKKP